MLTKEQAIDELVNFHNCEGVYPSYGSYRMGHSTFIRPGSIYAKLFGSFDEALRAAKLPTFTERRQLTPKRLCQGCDVVLTKRYQKRFCSASCAAKVNNPIRTQRLRVCKVCGLHFIRHHRSQDACSIECVNKVKRDVSKARFERGELTNVNSIKSHIIEMHGYSCICCGISTWNDKPITLELDHIDGDPDNNMPSNLQLLCPNCHSQTPTFRTYNRGSHKSDRRSLSNRKRYHRETSD
jgi:hypothetical protein